MKLIFGPQREPMVVPDDCELRDYGFSADFGGPKKPDSAVAAGTDRDKAVLEPKFGPQGEILRPISEEGICPLCGQQFPEACSEDGGQVSDPQQLMREDEDDEDDEEKIKLTDANIMELYS